MYKVVLLGSGDLGYGVLQGLVESEHELLAVMPWETIHTRSWKSFLKRQFIEDTQSLINRYGIRQLSPCLANSPEFAEQLAELKPDVLMVASWGEIFNPEVIALASVACINVHPSLLPKFRGPAPISSVLRAGETHTGVTFHYMTEGIDAGDILMQSQVPITGDDNSDTLTRKLSLRAKEMVTAALDNLRNPDFHAKAQDAGDASYHSRIDPAQLRIDWQATANVIHNQVRASSRQRNSFTHINDLMPIGVLRTQVIDLHRPSSRPGEVLYKIGTQLVVATGNERKAIVLTDVKMPGKLGSLRGKLFVARSVNVGECLT